MTFSCAGNPQNLQPCARRFQHSDNTGLSPPSAFFSELLSTPLKKQGGTVLRIKADHATMSCHACGAVDKWNPAETLTHTCTKCGLSWDQDYNAARNVLKQGLAVLSRTEQ